jgi:hypothetical protein
MREAETSSRAAAIITTLYRNFSLWADPVEWKFDLDDVDVMIDARSAYG